MTESGRSESRESGGVPSSVPEGTPYEHPEQHSFLLQAMFEVKGSLGQLTEAVTTLQGESKTQRDKIDGLKHLVSVALAVVTLAVVFLGWLLSTFKDEILEVIRSSSGG